MSYVFRSNRRIVLGAMCVAASLLMETSSSEAAATRFVRFEHQGKIAYGIVEGDKIQVIDGSPFGQWSKTDESLSLANVKVLAPTQPTKVLALALNYKSHAGNLKPHEHPQVFYKLPSSLVATGENIVFPPGASDVHYEAELVIVIGKRAKNVSVEDAKNYVLGVTCGNDVSERIWQKKDVQWWRAKGSDTFGPCGPFIVTGIDYDNLDMKLRVNGEVHLETNTREMIHNVAQTVSWISKHVTLEPGDLIFTGTAGITKPIKPGDVVEVEIEGVGILKNPVVGTKETST
ncbi:MAG: fumarylacetoacetate hydrolase family protein [Planctomycetota bacterium]